MIQGKFRKLANLGQGLSRMKIIAYKSSEFSQTDLVGRGFFLVQTNPETYKIGYRIEYGNKQESGLSVFDPPWNKNLPRELAFDFLIDGTNAIDTANPLIDINFPISDLGNEIFDEVLSRGTVYAQIEWFKATVYNILGERHAPNYLILQWGTLFFRCRLKSMDIEYKLFSPEGFPLRAMIRATFQETVRNSDQERLVKPSSPDVTHQRIVKDGDKLPLMAREIYGDHQYFFEVAKANKLIQFRNLNRGQTVTFPSIKRGDE